MAPRRTRRRRADLLVVWGIAGLVWPGAAAAQLEETFRLEECQAAVARVPTGRIIRLRLSNGGHVGGPIRQWNAQAVTLGPYVGYAERDTSVAIQTIDTLWMRAQATRRGALFGGMAGTALGVVLGATAGSLCPTSREPKVCTQGAVTSSVAGLVIGGLVGSLVGSGAPTWRRLHPRGERGPGAHAGSPITLEAPGVSTSPDPRTVVLARVRPGSLIRLQFADRPDLAGYVVRAGARRAVLAAIAGPSGEGPVSLESLEAIWERGSAQRGASGIGALLGFGVGAYVAAESAACLPNNDCRATIIANGVLGGLVGWVVGGRVGSVIPKWQRRY